MPPVPHAGSQDAADYPSLTYTSGPPKAGRSERLDALAAYIATFDTFPRSPYRNDDGTITEAAVRGKAIFERHDCLDYHSGPALTDSALGLRHDVGTLTAASGGRLGGELDGLDTPTLYGLYATAPYLHDGSAATLFDVLALPEHGNARRLSEEDQAALVAFLLQLEPDVVVETRGCGCSSAGRSGWFLGLPALLVLRRRARGRAITSP